MRQREWDRPGVVQLPPLPVVILLQAFEPVCGLTTPGPVQDVLEGGRHIQVLVNWKGHAIVEVVEKAECPLVDRSHRVEHSHLKNT